MLYISLQNTGLCHGSYSSYEIFSLLLHVCSGGSKSCPCQAPSRMAIVDETLSHGVCTSTHYAYEVGAVEAIPVPTGASRQLIHELCDNKQVVQKAVHAFVANAEYQYRGLEDFEAYVFEAERLIDAELVCEGKGERVVDGVMDWVEIVYVKAW